MAPRQPLGLRTYWFFSKTGPYRRWSSYGMADPNGGGKSRDRPERGRSEVAALVREVVRVTAVLSGKCGQGNGRPWSRPTTGAADATAAAFWA
jgi:hypothetical protein